MAFDDIKQSIKWAKDGGNVYAYFTAHYASYLDDQNKREHDTVRYAIGYLHASGNSLVGDLTDVFANTDKQVPVGVLGDPDHPIHDEGLDEGMRPSPRLSYRLEVHADGTIGVQPKIDGNPIGGMPVEKLTGEAVGNSLMRAASSTTAFAVSLDRRPKTVIPG